MSVFSIAADLVRAAISAPLETTVIETEARERPASVRMRRGSHWPLLLLGVVATGAMAWLLFTPPKSGPGEIVAPDYFPPRSGGDVVTLSEVNHILIWLLGVGVVLGLAYVLFRSLNIASVPVERRTDIESGPKKRRTTEVVATPKFKLVFLAIVAIVIGSVVAQIAMVSMWPTPTPAQVNVIENLSFAWKAGLGAIFGLLGGKAT